MRVLSLGAGVQSTTLALMAAHGEIEPPDVAIFADTQWEPAAVYEHLRWLMSPNVLPFPVNIVSRGSILHNIKTRRQTSGGRFAAVPWHTVNADGSLGMGRRQCSSEYKLNAIAQEIRRLLGKGPRDRIPPGAVDVLIGISRDEAHRMRDARQKYMRNRYPLVDRGMRRYDCLLWLDRHGYGQPPKSACVGCPYHSNDYWRALKANSPSEWDEAVATDRLLREGDARGIRGAEYMHRSCVPLDQVDLSLDDRQADLFGNECEGMCGV